MPDFLPGLPVARILDCLTRAPGNEIRSGKFDSPESSSALAANAFGWFLTRPQVLPPLPGVPMGQVQSLTLAAEMRFPWSGGRHPWLDVGIATHTTLIGIAARRYEPFRPQKLSGFAEVQDRPIWGARMGRFTRLRDDLVSGAVAFQALDAVQLIKQAYGLHTQSEKRGTGAVMVYLYAEPATWANAKPVDPARIARHRHELADFAARVQGDSVTFAALRWTDLLEQWAAMPPLAAHAAALTARFGPLG